MGYTPSGHDLCIPIGANPSCLQTTLASLLSQKSSHTVPHWLLHISTRPSWVFCPSWSLMSPYVQLPEGEYSNICASTFPQFMYISRHDRLCKMVVHWWLFTKGCSLIVGNLSTCHTSYPMESLKKISGDLVSLAAHGKGSSYIRPTITMQLFSYSSCWGCVMETWFQLAYHYIIVEHNHDCLLKHLTPASSEWLQFRMLIAFGIQFERLSSLPMHCALSKWMGPVPSPNCALGNGIAPARIYWSTVNWKSCEMQNTE